MIIIGAGYGGLALANIMAKDGYEVHVYEKNDIPGGRAGLLKQDGFIFDTGPSWYLMPEVFEQYYRLFGKSAQKELDLIKLQPAYRVFFEAYEPVTIYGELKKDAKTFNLIEPGAGKALRSYVARSSETYRLALKHFLYTNFQRPRELLQKEVLRNLPRMLKLAFRPLHRYVARYFHNLHLQQILEYPMVFLGSSPFEAPALYSLMSSLDFESGVYYPKRGMYDLIQSMVRLGKELGVTYHYGQPVQRIIVEHGRAVGVKLQTGPTAKADIIVSNADTHFTETELLPRRYQSFPQKYWDKRRPGPSALLLSLGIKGKLPQLEHHNLLFVNDWRENFHAIYQDHVIPKNASMYVCNPSKTDPKLAPKNHENIFVLIPLPSGVQLNEYEQQQLAERFINQLGDMIDEPELSQKIVTKHIFGPNQFGSRFHAWQNGALGGESHVLLQSALFRTPNKSKKVKHLYYTGAGTVPGIGLPMCLMSAQLTYKRIKGIKRGGPLNGIGKEKHG